MKLPPRIHAPKEAPLPVNYPKNRARIRAFRVPMDYVFDVVRGYQGDADTFKIYGMAGENLPEGVKLWNQGAWVEHVRGGGLYFIVEHESFPEHELGSGIIPEIPFVIGEREVSSAGR